MKIEYKIGGALVLLALVVITLFNIVGINYNGYRTVVQLPTGTTFVKFSPGPYVQLFGNVTTYPDIITFDFDKDQNQEVRTMEQEGIPVRYQDGGTGKIYGQARFNLPNDEATMLLLHRAFRTTEGLGYKLLKPTTEERVNLTAGLMSSEEAYTQKRGTFIEWARDQVQHGKYRTRLETKQVKDDAATAVDGDTKTVYKDVPVIAYGKDGLPEYLDNDFTLYGIALTGFQIVDWDFEPRTLEQIAAKRKATMAIITAKAEAERAKQDAITAEQEGLKNVTVAKYEKEVEKERAVVDATRAKEVAVIAAKQKVDVAEQNKLEQEQNKLAMAEYKQAQTLRGEGDAAYKKLVIEADNALEQKLATYEKVMAVFAQEFGKQKWVPNIQMGTPTGGSGNEAANLINLLTAKTVKDLDLDMSVNQKK